MSQFLAEFTCRFIHFVIILNCPYICSIYCIFIIDIYWSYTTIRQLLDLLDGNIYWLSIFCSTALCGGNVTSLNGTIYSPGHPEEYPNFQDCVWSVRVPPGHGIYINFTVLSTEPIYDYITVWLVFILPSCLVIEKKWRQNFNQSINYNLFATVAMANNWNCCCCTVSDQEQNTLSV